MTAGSLVLTFTPTSTAREPHDVTSFVAARVGDEDPWAGFSLRQEPLGSRDAPWDCPENGGFPQLIVEYTLPDITPPETDIDSGPPAVSASTSAFSGSDDVTDAGDLIFECQLDGGGFSLCSSPKPYAGLSGGSHTFQVRATDEAGATDPTPASYTWAAAVCNGQAATIYVAEGKIVGGPQKGQAYKGRLQGGDGNDVMFGTAARDELIGGGGADSLCGHDGNDVLKGGDGDDTLTGGAGADKFQGGNGTDTATDFNAAQGDQKQQVESP